MSEMTLKQRCQAILERGTKPCIPEVLPLVLEFYAMPGNGVGGALHIVLDDGNVEASHVEWCVKRASEEGDVDAEILGRVLLLMSITQRTKLYMEPKPWN